MLISAIMRLFKDFKPWQTTYDLPEVPPMYKSLAADDFLNTDRLERLFLDHLMNRADKSHGLTNAYLSAYSDFLQDLLSDMEFDGGFAQSSDPTLLNGLVVGRYVLTRHVIEVGLFMGLTHRGDGSSYSLALMAMKAFSDLAFRIAPPSSSNYPNRLHNYSQGSHLACWGYCSLTFKVENDFSVFRKVLALLIQNQVRLDFWLFHCDHMLPSETASDLLIRYVSYWIKEYEKPSFIDNMEKWSKKTTFHRWLWPKGPKDPNRLFMLITVLDVLGLYSDSKSITGLTRKEALGYISREGADTYMAKLKTFEQDYAGSSNMCWLFLKDVS